MNGCPSCSCPIHTSQRAQASATLSNRANQVVTTVKKVTRTEVSDELPQTQTNVRVYTSNNSRSGGDSLRNSRVTRKTVYGEKYDYGEKVKEKRNYILYASGTMREKKEIEQIEQIEQPQPQPTILEEHEIIDNYKYHESKNIRKQNPNRLSFTMHKRLSGPFEKTTYTQVTEDGYPYQSYVGRKTTSTYQSRLNSMPKQRISYDTYTPKTYKSYRNYSSGNYRYQNRPYNENVTRTEIVRKNRGRRDLGFYETNVDECYEYVPPETEQVEVIEQRVREKNPFSQYQYQGGETHTETKQDGDYIVKITTTRNSLSNDYNNLNNTWGNYNYANRRTNFGNNYNYYESKNVRKTERVNKPMSYDFNLRSEQTGRSASYNNNLRSAGFSNSGNEYKRYEEITRCSGTCACGKKHYGDTYRRQKYETEEEVFCPVHGRQTIRREYEY